MHSAYYPSSEAAFAGWQDGVGETASAGTVLAPATDRSLLASLLPADTGFMRPGGENAEQFAEYHRSKRLAEVVLPVVPATEGRPDTDLTSATAAVEFTAWLRGRVSDDSAQSEVLDAYAEELADSWNLSRIGAVFATCSPHRVALCVLHVRNYYVEDFAEQLVALLPDWVRWLSTGGAITPELADRCLPYAHGRPHPQLGHDDSDVSWQARVIE
ncbi:MAG: hypothetical protein L0I76_01540 [Pseudonocardia sp.]|nr:hypothetical protein [Pseudonocardia sp.]